MKILRAAVDFWRRSPHARLVVRAGATSIAAYVADSIKAGTPFSLAALGLAAATGAGYALLGLFTPIEPNAGLVKAKVEK